MKFKITSYKTIFTLLWQGLKKYFFLLGLIVTIAYFYFVFFLFNTEDLTVDLPKSGFIVDMTISGEIVDNYPSNKSLLLGLLADQPKKFHINRLIRTIDRVRVDSRVKGLFLNWSGSKSNLSQQIRLNEALQRLRQQKPDLPIYFYANNIDRGALLLSASANRITIPPVASVLVTGPILQLTYFGEAAKKLGVGFTVFKTGPHKAAFEPYVRSTPSAEVLAEYNEISAEISRDIVQRVATGRQRPLAVVQEWFSQSLFTVSAALEQEIVTDTGYADTLLSELKLTLGLDNDVVNASNYFHSSKRVDEPKVSTSKNTKLGFIYANGAISHQNSNGGAKERITAEGLIKQIDWAKNDDDVKAVVMRISSPGGSAQASELIWHHLTELAKQKPLVVSMGSVAASGGYYLAAAGHKIIAESTTVTGSIGVTAILPEVEKLQEKLGVYFHTISESDRKRLLSIESKPTELDVAIVNLGLQETYTTFLDRVSVGRRLALADVEALAGGRIYTGAKAAKIGLVDEIGDTATAFEIAKKLAGLDPEKYYTTSSYSSENRTVLGCLLRSGIENCVSQSQLSLSLSKLSIFSQLAQFAELLESQQQGPRVLTYLPINMEM